MNALWVVSDLGGLPRLRYVALAAGGVGAVLLGIAVLPANGERWELSRFRRLRVDDR